MTTKIKISQDVSDVDLISVSPTNGQALIFNTGTNKWVPGGAGTNVYNNINNLPLSNVNVGTMALVTSTGKLYIYIGTGWYNIATVNASPSAITGAENSYAFATDGTPTVLTLVSSDPEGIPLTWSYTVTSGSLTNGGGTTATVSQNNNVFTITPSTNQNYAGTFSLTFSASDGINLATAVSSFTLVFTIVNSKYTTLLLNGNGTNGAQNNTFIDGSTNNFTITRNGNTTQGTFTPYGNNWSNYFDGTGDYLVAPDNDALEPGSSNLTWEVWINTTSSTQYATLYSRTTATFASGMWTLMINLASSTAGDAGLYVANFSTASPLLQTTGVSVRDNAWHHIAVVRNGSSWVLYVDGISRATATWAGTIANIAGGPYIGSDQFYGRNYAGYMSNLRIVNNTALYTANFTPPTAPLTAIANTSLLTCQSNTFKDNSTNNFAITQNGDVKVQRFIPFDILPYNSTLGGSAYFDGNGDYLTGPTSNAAFQFGTGNFTIEYWLYQTASGSYRTVLDTRASGTASPWACLINSSNQPYILITSDLTSTIPIVINAWNHVAIVRSGTSLSIFVNGVRGLNTTDSTNIAPTGTLRVGFTVDSLYAIVGYLSNIRIVKGTAVYDPTQSTCTVPTIPLTAITNTQLLLNFTNAGIYDNAMMNNLETVGNAQLSTAVKKFGNSSLSFDGTLDSLKIVDNPNINLGTSDFTIECWAYFNVVNAEMSLINKGWQSSSAYASYLIYMTSGGSLRFNASTNGGAWDIANEVVIGAMTATTWTHIAVTRSGTTYRAFINGAIVSGFTFTNSGSHANIAAQALYIGGVTNNNSSMNGYLDDVRITKGYARYTANFTPPTSDLQG